MLPLKFKNASDYDMLAQGDVLVLDQLDAALAAGPEIEIAIDGRGERLTLIHQLSPRQVAVLRVGGLINWMRERN